ncbi:hypothetical protein CNY89_30725, partial [Amaricoccus sp. HAR-UPW-R2A-40]
FRLPVMKAVGVSEEGDLEGLPAYAGAVDMLLIDAFRLPVMKAVGVSEEGDLEGLPAYAGAVDMLLI